MVQTRRGKIDCKGISFNRGEGDIPRDDRRTEKASSRAEVTVKRPNPRGKGRQKRGRDFKTDQSVQPHRGMKEVEKKRTSGRERLGPR